MLLLESPESCVWKITNAPQLGGGVGPYAQAVSCFMHCGIMTQLRNDEISAFRSLIAWSFSFRKRRRAELLLNKSGRGRCRTAGPQADHAARLVSSPLGKSG